MRYREEIERDANPMRYREEIERDESSTNFRDKLILEVLLDIREQLGYFIEDKMPLNVRVMD